MKRIDLYLWRVKKVSPQLRFIPPTLVICAILAIYFFIFYNLPSPTKLKDYKTVPLSTHITDRNGKLLYEIYREQNRTPIKLSDLPPYVSQATISIEDKDFFKHSGISLFSGIARALKDMVIGHNLQGGSTLTQQLVKSALLSPERTVRRKIREIVLALWTEQLYSKNQILELYLNQVPYGGSAYGIEEAARTYFGKHAKELTLAEAALLAGLPQAPSLYSPFYNLDAAVYRRNEILKKMREQGYITENQRKEAETTKITINPPRTAIKAPHFVFYVKQQLEKLYSTEQVEEGGLNVVTTLDLDTQQEAEKIMKDELEKIKNLNVSNGAALVTRPSTGEILAMVGSVDYFATPSGAFNVTTALRQPGSSIKPLNYAIGLDRKIVTPSSVFLDVPTCFPSIPTRYCPVNYDGQFHGPVQLRFALGNSLNIPAVKMLALNGVDNFVASASAFTISTFEDPSRYGLSLTLGGGEVRMVEMAQAFSAFPNRGTPRKVVSILKVQDKLGKELYKYQDVNFIADIKQALKYPNFLAIAGKKVVSPETAFLISHILLDNNARMMAFGPSSFLVVPNRAVSVKTGTTDDKKDNWTIGFTPNFLSAVWVGNNDNTPMNPYLTSGITGAAPIWNKIMASILKNQPDLWPIRPDTVVGRSVCSTGQVVEQKDGQDQTKDGCNPRFEYFIKGTEASQSASIKREEIFVTKDSNLQAREGDPNTEKKEKTVIKDGFSTYCVDCAHEPTPTPPAH